MNAELRMTQDWSVCKTLGPMFSSGRLYDDDDDHLHKRYPPLCASAAIIKSSRHAHSASHYTKLCLPIKKNVSCKRAFILMQFKSELNWLIFKLAVELLTLTDFHIVRSNSFSIHR